MTEWFELHSPTIAPLELTAEDSDQLARVIESLIPATQERPSGATVLLNRRMLTAALAVRPDLSSAIETVLAFLKEAQQGSSVQATVQEMFVAHPDQLDDFGKLIAGAYLMDPDVKSAIGYPGQEDRQLTDDTADYVELLEAVLDRGEFYRPTPEQK